VFLKLLLLFTLVPFIELAILIKLGEVIGLWPTLAIVLITGVAGAALAKGEGLAVASKIKGELQQGHIPGRQLINGLLVLIGGVLLLTPGLITDFAGFLLITPGPRDLIRERIIAYLKRKIETNSIRIHY
jgi:UPF0716 protein FxsA